MHKNVGISTIRTYPNYSLNDVFRNSFVIIIQRMGVVGKFCRSAGFHPHIYTSPETVILQKIFEPEKQSFCAIKGGDAVSDINKIYLPDIVGRGYGAFWRFKGRYRIVKGSRASKKSKTTALNFIVRLMQYPQANLLVVRKTERTLKTSCYTELKWAINRLGVGDYWKCTINPLEMEYIPTGQKIYFRGLDDPLKVTSITVETGVLCFLWIEEAYEINSEADFDMLDESIRGKAPPGLFKQVTATLNPWSEHHWIKKRFFDAPPSPDILAITTNYMCNEWLDESDLRLFEEMKKNRPKRYRVAGLGDWGVTEGVIYENWRESRFDVQEIARREGIKPVFGLDFGYSVDPTAFFCGMLDEQNKKIYVFDELYEKGLSNEEIYSRITEMGYGKEKIIADSAEPKSIDRLRELGLYRIKGARKGRDSINNGIDFLQGFEIIVHPRCVNFITEIGNYQWDSDKFGKLINRPVDAGNHLMDAMRYATEDVSKGDVFSFE